jgi:hypothetical protein
VRTCFEFAETDEYFAVRDLLIRRCERWAAGLGLPMSPKLAEAVLDSRHFSVDGRLGYWTAEQVCWALLDWLPGKVAVPGEDLLPAPETLRTLLRYLDSHGLRDPRGADLKDNEAAIDSAAARFAEAIRDEGRYGMAKIVAMSARDHGVDFSDPGAMRAFVEKVQTGRVVLDAERMQRAMERGSLEQERAIPQLPVRLPPADELAEAAGLSVAVKRLTQFATWVGAGGRVLTASGHLKPADARELVKLLGTGEEGLKFRSATELPILSRIVSWATRARLVRRQGTRLVPVAKAKPVLADAEALWQRAFDAVFELADVVCRPMFANEPASPVRQMYADIVPDLMNTIYGFPEPVPVARLTESVWLGVCENFQVDMLSPRQQDTLHWRVDSDVQHIFDTFEELGAVTSVHGVAHEVWTSDLDGSLGDDAQFTEDQAATLREKLAEPGRLVSLTPLGTRAMRQRLLAEGRDAPLVGELTGAGAAEMLGLVSERYTDDTAVEEIALWREAHGGSDGSLAPLVQAIRDCPFLSRQVAMLKVLARAVPEGDVLIEGLRRDPGLAPVAVIADKGGQAPDEADEDDMPALMAGSLLQFLELGGPELVLAQLRGLPRENALGYVEAVRDSGFPRTRHSMSSWS